VLNTEHQPFFQNISKTKGCEAEKDYNKGSELNPQAIAIIALPRRSKRKVTASPEAASGMAYFYTAPRVSSG